MRRFAAEKAPKSLQTHCWNFHFRVAASHLSLLWKTKTNKNLNFNLSSAAAFLVSVSMASSPVTIDTINPKVIFLCTPPPQIFVGFEQIVFLIVAMLLVGFMCLVFVSTVFLNCSCVEFLVVVWSQRVVGSSLLHFSSWWICGFNHVSCCNRKVTSFWFIYALSIYL